VWGPLQQFMSILAPAIGAGSTASASSGGNPGLLGTFTSLFGGGGPFGSGGRFF